MIIKKSKIPNNMAQETNPSEDNLEEVMPVIKERQERRRGDRRRGYRRIDDRNLISRAHEEASAIKDRAAKEGFEYGLAQANNEIIKLKDAIENLINAKEKAMQEAASDISFLAIKVAERIIKTEVACDETIVLNIISEVLKEIGKDETRIIIKTNPSNTQLVKQKIPDLFPYGNANAKIIVVDDKDIEWGSCIVETSSGMIDAKFSTQLQILTKALSQDNKER